jgi:hypothetical protein
VKTISEIGQTWASIRNGSGNGRYGRHEMAHFKTVKVHIDCRVETERLRCSVPHRWSGE